MCWIVQTFLCFCLISNKQPHYLMPLMPGAVLLTALFLRSVSTRKLAQTMVVMVGLIVAAQAAASLTFLTRYDLAPIATYVQANRDKDWAFASNYRAELGFLAGLEKPIADMSSRELEPWFLLHPNGLAIMTYKDAKEIAPTAKSWTRPIGAEGSACSERCSPWRRGWVCRSATMLPFLRKLSVMPSDCLTGGGGTSRPNSIL